MYADKIKNYKIKEDAIILAIESSCDETAAAVVKNGREVLSHSMFTQIAIHAEYGGVVPEIASRNHLEKLPYVVEDALRQAGMTFAEVDALAAQVMNTLAGAVKRQPDLVPVAYDTQKVQAICAVLGKLYGGEQSAAVGFAVNPEILAYDPATESLSPDHIVYAKAKQLSLPADVDAVGIESAFAVFTAQNGYQPKIVFVQGLGMFSCGLSAQEAATAQSVMLDAIKVVAYAESFGGVSPMPAFLIDFIVNWEVESYRAKISLQK